VGPLAPPKLALRGFTLVEILVVMLIVGVAGGLVVLSLDRDERGTTAREAKRFAGALEHAAARAQARHETLGVSADRALRFWRRVPDSDRWQPVDDDDVLATRVFPEPLAAAAYTYAGQRAAADAIVPFRPTGHNEPFAFVLATPEWRAMLLSDPLNRVTIDGPEPVTP